MTIRNTTIRPTDLLRARGHAAGARMISWLIGAALAVPLGLAPAASAQDYEYEPDEGWHEEEWYDPTDWFDDRPYNYEYDYDGYGYYDSDYYTDEDDPVDYDYWDSPYDYDYRPLDRVRYSYSDYTTSLQHHAYLDGYYDGYYDDQFGIDHWDTLWSNTYSVSYSSGYYDGYYDAQQDYHYEPTYYLVTGNMDNEQESQRQRSNDQTRQRGDRAERQDRNAQRDGWMAASTDRKRGTIERIQEADVDSRPENHTVLRLRMDDGKTVTADFGPRVTRQRLPFSQGDRVTLAGDKITRDGDELFVVSKVLSGDQTLTLRRTSRDGYNGQRQQDARRDQWQQPQRDSRNQWRQPQRDNRDQWRQNQQRDTDQQRWDDSGQDARDSRYQQSNRQVTLTGELTRVQSANRALEGYQLFRVRIDDGQERMLAATEQWAGQLRVHEGDRVQINGRWGTVGDQQVIILSRMRSRSGSGS